MKNIELRKITEFEDFNPREFCLKPSWWRLTAVSSYEVKDLVEEAKQLAESIDGICVAIVHDTLGDFAISESCNSGCSQKFLLFNAAKTSRENAEVRAITFNTGRGALTRYWYDEWLKYEPGSIV